MKALNLTPEQALEATKTIAERQRRSHLNIADFDKNFSFASPDEVREQSKVIRAKFDKTIKELASR